MKKFEKDTVFSALTIAFLFMFVFAGTLQADTDIPEAFDNRIFSYSSEKVGSIDLEYTNGQITYILAKINFSDSCTIRQIDGDIGHKFGADEIEQTGRLFQANYSHSTQSTDSGKRTYRIDINGELLSNGLIQCTYSAKECYAPCFYLYGVWECETINCCSVSGYFTLEAHLPKVLTSPIFSKSFTGAIGGGNVTSEGTSSVTSKGILLEHLF